ncbi:MAG: (d)CMP kinase [Lachnospiraceae bacterium]|nr:(d)CMP kinase [Lachnospiraceae bacterium]
MGYQIAIDGPAGAGKSTIAKLIAKQKNFIYVDTGAMYRAMALFLLRSNINANDDEAVSLICPKAEITIRYENNEQIVLLNGENVNAYLRTEEVGLIASKSSANPKVREHLLGLQIKLAEENDVVMDGRDIGTCVLPNANVKVFLTASSRIRAKRRYLELTANNANEESPLDLDDIEQDIIKRDNQDMSREHAPLKQAADAVLVDTSDLTIEEVSALIIEICGQKR